MPTKLQTQQTNLALMSVKVNGRRYEVDSKCCVVVDLPEDIARLKLVGWTATVGAITAPPKPSTRITPGSSLRGAEEFVELIQNDPKLAAVIADFKTFDEMAKYALTMGFKFLERDLQAAGSAYVERMNHSMKIDAANAAALLVPSVAPPPVTVVSEEDLQPLVSDFSDKDKLPERLPEEDSGHWPNPTDAMSLPYLRRMAAAYKVKYAASTSKELLLKKLQKSVYE